jgi:hypothetical protein
MARIRLAVTVIAYPAISATYGETVCVAGLRTDTLFSTEWVRLFPFKIRGPLVTPIRKWDEIEIEAGSHSGDKRPESMRPDLTSLRIVGHLGTKRRWEARRSLSDQLPVFDSMDHLRHSQQTDRTSLAAVRPHEVLDLEISPKTPQQIAELEAKVKKQTAQGDLFSVSDPTIPLEVLPYDFHFVVRGPDSTEPERLKIVDWEIGNTWRKWRHEYPDVLERIRTRWVDDMCGPKRAPLFFVGNMHRFQDQFLLLSVYSPPS